MIDRLLKDFLAAANPAPFAYAFCHHQPPKGGDRSRVPDRAHVVVCVLTHGNEFGTLPAALALVRRLQEGSIASAVPVTVVVGNPEAAKRGERLIEEDLNRVFTFDRPAQSHERRRAEELRPILDTADYVLDLHQTQTPTACPFYTFPWTDDLPAWARAIAGAEVGLTRPGGDSFSPGKRCLDEYVRDRGRMGLTLEMGTQGLDAEQEERSLAAMQRFIQLAEAIAVGRDIATLAEEKPPIEWYHTAHIERDAPANVRLRPGFGSWSPVQAGELLTAEGSPELRAPSDGYILFPKYPVPGKPDSPELYRLARRVDDPSREFEAGA